MRCHIDNLKRRQIQFGPFTRCYFSNFRQLCTLLNAEFIYRTFAEIIFEETVNVKFASIMVRTLHTILITSSELFDLRSQLKDIRNEVKLFGNSMYSLIGMSVEFQKSASLFQCLYKSWCHCPISTLSLCLLSQCYQHCSELVLIFGDLEITVEFITEIDRLVQLIESPIFACKIWLFFDFKRNLTNSFISSAFDARFKQ